MQTPLASKNIEQLRKDYALGRRSRRCIDLEQYDLLCDEGGFRFESSNRHVGPSVTHVVLLDDNRIEFCESMENRDETTIKYYEWGEVEEEKATLYSCLSQG